MPIFAGDKLRELTQKLCSPRRRTQRAMRYVLTTSCLLFSLAACWSWSRLCQAVAPLPGWQLAWHDEFDGTSLNNELWEAIDRRNSPNNEQQYYRPEQVHVAGGHLQLTAANESFDNRKYRSGLIKSRAVYGPGRFEARIRLPTSQGMWPAFWLNPNQVQWPTGGEIDIMENKGHEPLLTSSAYHWQSKPGPCCDQHKFVVHNYTATEDGKPVDFHAGFHKFAVEWEDAQLRFYVDDNLHFTIQERTDLPVFETPKNVILNLAVGGDFGGDPDESTRWPQVMLVDYVRVWRPQNDSDPTPMGVSQADAVEQTVRPVLSD